MTSKKGKNGGMNKERDIRAIVTLGHEDKAPSPEFHQVKPLTRGKPEEDKIDVAEVASEDDGTKAFLVRIEKLITNISKEGEGNFTQQYLANAEQQMRGTRVISALKTENLRQSVIDKLLMSVKGMNNPLLLVRILETLNSPARDGVGVQFNAIVNTSNVGFKLKENVSSTKTAINLGEMAQVVKQVDEK